MENAYLARVPTARRENRAREERLAVEGVRSHRAQGK